MKLIENWKQCWKMSSFQLSVIVIILEWTNNIFVAMPNDITGWGQAIGVLLLPIARLWKQSSVSGD